MASRGVAWECDGNLRQMSKAEILTATQNMNTCQPVTDSSKKKMNRGLLIGMGLIGMIGGVAYVMRNSISEQWNNILDRGVRNTTTETLSTDSTSADAFYDIPQEAKDLFRGVEETVEEVAETFYDIPQDAKDLFRGVEETVDEVVTTVSESYYQPTIESVKKK